MTMCGALSLCGADGIHMADCDRMLSVTHMTHDMREHERTFALATSLSTPTQISHGSYSFCQ